MAELVALDRGEGRLCGVLAAALARFLTGSDGEAGSGRAGAAFYHESDPVLEEATRALKDLGLAEPVPRADAPGERWYCLHALTMEAEAMPGFLAARLPAGDPLRARILVPFLRIACERDTLPTTHPPFPAPAAYGEAMRALARTGYARGFGTAFAWTGRIGPMMREAGLWDEHDRCRAALRDSERDAQARSAWRTMPETIRRAHFRDRRVGVVALADVLEKSWRAGAWHPMRQGAEEADVPSGHVGLARRIIELADARR